MGGCSQTAVTAESPRAGISSSKGAYQITPVGLSDDGPAKRQWEKYEENLQTGAIPEWTRDMQFDSPLRLNEYVTD